MDSVEILEIALEVYLVDLPGYPVDPGGSFAFERVECRSERVDVDMVEKRGEPLLLPLPCGLPYAVQRLGHARPGLRPVCALLISVPLGPFPLLRHLRCRWSGFVRRLPSYYAESDFSGSCIGGYGSSPSRRGPSAPRDFRPTRRSPGSRARSVRACQVLRPCRVTQALAMTSWACCLPLHRQRRHPESLFYRGSMVGLHVPLPTLRRHPRGGLRTARGRCGSLFRHRSGLAPPTPRRSPGAPVRKRSAAVMILP